MDKQFQDFINHIKARQFFAAVNTPIKLMCDAIVTSYNCHITGIF